MSHSRYQEYACGPTACAPTAPVIKSIRQQIRASRALSRGDVRLATAMRIIHADTIRPLGFNDSLFYPVSADLAPARGRPLERVAHAPLKKRLHALALLVDFSDNPGKRPAADFQKLLFDGNHPGSMTSLYHKLSYGALQVTGQVFGYIRAPQPYSYYTNGESGTGEFSYPNNTPGLLFDALTLFCAANSLAPFDLDGDGYVDGIFLIHAGGGAEAEPDPAKRPHKIWSHKWVLPKPFVNKGVKVYAYSTEPEDGRLGVFAHEFGHVLGLPDLYDSTYRSAGVGNWCLMGGGSWGGGGNQPTRMSCWCLAKLGWVQPKNIKKTQAITLPTLETTKGAAYRVWKKGKVGPEYFLLENRQRIGMDTALPGSGLAVWHIDETQSSNTNPRAYMVGLVQADGLRDLEKNKSSGDAGDLFPGSKKKTSIDDSTVPSTRAGDGSPTGIALSAIKQSAGQISVKVKV